ncbi:DUF3944 domain-containing protein [Pelistega sp. NLN82]|uniref:DUF3944 domain-containing protein n=1 Tax=Pelistega ratti TaxID=2652177 RepID=A0A6L9Y7Q4_9BURK|nr:DUF3944 domain-containing protein [Pelistega ratti]NEN76552.1 DUF3944 domain-containing protein [Pelistega ratti]
MAYRDDPDLAFLGTLNSEELNDLVYLIIHDKDGERRWTETLTVNEKYKRYAPNHSKYWQEIAEEIQHFGGNTFINIFRNAGVPYKEILCDVCDKLKVNYHKYASTKQIEQNLLMKILQQALEEMSPSQLKTLATEIGLDNISIPSAQAMTSIFLAIFRAGGFKSYQITVIIANAVLKTLIGRGLSFASNTLLTRTAAILTGPIGWAITALWTLIDIAGPAYRVTIPAVIQVIYLRSLSENRTEIEKINQIDISKINL